MEIKKGAEAIVILYKNSVRKIRNSKSYRIKKLDEMLRKKRTKQEFKILSKLYDNIPVPEPFKLFKYSYTMSRIYGEKPEPSSSLAKQMAELLHSIHSYDIIHGDFTPANIIQTKSELYVIDFGLGFFSKRIEDKADDLVALIQSLPSFKKVIKSFYIQDRNSEIVAERAEKIMRRARYTG